MSFFDTHYNGKAVLVDLGSESVEVVALERSLVEERVGGAALNRALFDRFSEDDPVIFGTGPLTGSFAPASCLLVATFRSPLSGRICNVPLTMRTGPQLKSAGFDFLVLRKKAADPKVIGMTGGQLSLAAGEGYVGLGLNETLALARREFGRPESWLWPGSATASCAALSISRGGSFDKAGLAAALLDKHVQGVFIQGNNGLPFGADDLYRSNLLIENLKKGLKKKEVGFAAVLGRFASEQTVKLVPRRKARHMACFRCPVPCMSHVPVPEGAGGSADGTEGILLADHLGFAALAKQSGPGAYRLMAASVQAGVDPAAVAGWMVRGATQDQALSRIESISMGSGDDTPSAPRGDDFYGPLRDEERDFFGGGLAPLYEANSIEDWKTTVSRAMIMGICPVLAARFPDLEGPLLGLAAVDKVHVTNLAKSLITTT